MKGKRLLFFATKNDMLHIFENYVLKYGKKMQYVEEGNHYNCPITIYNSINELPELGFLDSPNHCSLSYLVLSDSELINTESLYLKDRSKVYAVYQNLNPNSVVFSPSGIYKKNKSLIHGQLSTISESDISKALFKEIKSVIKNSFLNYKGWYIGAEAKNLYGKIRFVTISADSPTEYDLKINNL